ncbi:MAG: CIC family chloride channel protein [Motiliproteus sp.]|jgi:CIC family chloride channel protein
MRMNPLGLNHFRLRIGDTDALPQWLLIGLLSGLLTGLLMLALHHAITWPLQQGLPAGDPENFEALPPLARLLLPMLGSLVVGLVLWRFKSAAKVGITHVLERLSYHQGRMPLPNLLVQFVTASISLISGHSGGREGPAVHLGAAASSLLGQHLRLPNNSLRTLIGCGTAAAIAAAFNTPLAGIIFAMEVVMMEYTVAGFIPVMVAAITSALVLRLSLGEYSVFEVPAFEIQTLQEIPFIILLGIVVGLLAVLFSKLLVAIGDWQKPPIFVRLQIAGVATGIAALWLPEIMGLGYDTVNQILSGQSTLEFLLILAVVKLLITAIAIGLGMPMGLIGPTLFIGAAAGAAMGVLGIAAASTPVSDIGLYAMLGMGAMMAATLQAPLAALMALLEMTLNANIILPGALAILSATLTYRYCFRQGSAFQALLLSRGLDWRRAPLERFLERTSVFALMLKNPPQSSRYPEPTATQRLASSEGDWILVLDQGQPRVCLARADLLLHLQRLQEPATEFPGELKESLVRADLSLTSQHSQHPQPLQEQQEQQEQQRPDPQQQKPSTDKPDKPGEPIDLLDIPALRLDLAEISIQASLHEALQTLNLHNVDALCVLSHTQAPLGLLLRTSINHHYMHKKSE